MKKINKIVEEKISFLELIKACEASSTVIVESYDSCDMVSDKEASIGRKIPTCLVESFSDKDRFISWIMDSLSDDLPEKYDDLCAGNGRLDLETFCDVELDKMHFLQKSRSNAKLKPVWDKAFAFAYCSFDSFVALDDPYNDDGSQVVLLEAKGKKIIGCHLLANDVYSFFDAWADLAFFQLSTNSLALFTDNFTKPLDSQSDFALEWKDWLVNGK
jgi:hypothetical protein